MDLVLFDCDGVLVNSEEVTHDAIRTRIEAEGLVYTDEDYYEFSSGLSPSDFIGHIRSGAKSKLGKDISDDFFQKLADVFLQEEVKHLKAIDGVREILDDLKARGVPFCIASNSGVVGLERKLKQVGLYDDFAPRIYSRQHVANPKPAPDLYLYAMKQMGFGDVSRCIVVEDSKAGVTAGVAAGMYVVGYAGGAHRPSYHGNHLAMLGASAVFSCMHSIRSHVCPMFGTRPPLSVVMPAPRRQI